MALAPPVDVDGVADLTLSMQNTVHFQFPQAHEALSIRLRRPNPSMDGLLLPIGQSVRNELFGVFRPVRPPRLIPAGGFSGGLLVDALPVARLDRAERDGLH